MAGEREKERDKKIKRTAVWKKLSACKRPKRRNALLGLFFVCLYLENILQTRPINLDIKLSKRNIAVTLDMQYRLTTL